jgi:hypothetical protein
MKTLSLILLFLSLSGCGAVDLIFGTKPKTGGISSTISETATAAIPENLSMLSGIGGISILGGIVLLVASSGRKGWYPVLGGIGLIFINTLLQQYFHLIALPIIVASGIVSALWALKALGQARIVKLKKGI